MSATEFCERANAELPRGVGLVFSAIEGDVLISAEFNCKHYAKRIKGDTLKVDDVPEMVKTLTSLWDHDRNALAEELKQ